ncbi:Protein of unknown function [Gryllus bimaculatus]|nr:Protein of unknown function [Gryllus bimaculatus]
MCCRLRVGVFQRAAPAVGVGAGVVGAGGAAGRAFAVRWRAARLARGQRPAARARAARRLPAREAPLERLLGADVTAPASCRRSAPRGAGVVIRADFSRELLLGAPPQSWPGPRARRAGAARRGPAGQRRRRRPAARGPTSAARQGSGTR